MEKMLAGLAHKSPEGAANLRNFMNPTSGWQPLERLSRLAQSNY